jgi:glycosyltransferase involved in cell wall biosynthesis
VRGLDPQVVSQRLVTGNCDDDEADYIETQAPEIQATYIDGLGRSVRPIDDVRAFIKLSMILRSSRPDIVHTHTSKAGSLGRLATKLSGIGVKIIHNYHGHSLHGYFGSAKTKAWIQSEKVMAFLIDEIITVGDAVQWDLFKSGIGSASQYKTIRSGSRIEAHMGEHHVRTDLMAQPAQTVVSMISRLTQVKRIDRSLDVVRLVANDRKDIHFLLVGDGEFSSDVRDAVAREELPVSVLGWRNDIGTIIATTDLMFLTSDNEGIPISLIEGAAFRIPAVATGVVAVSEVVRHGQTGLLCETNARSLADAIMYLANNPETRKAMAHRAQSVVTSKFSMEEFLGKHQLVYENSLEETWQHSERIAETTARSLIERLHGNGKH